MTEALPANGQRVEVFVGGEWLPAVFFAGDSIATNIPDPDEVWWNDYFLLENGDTIPEDVHSGDDLPKWR